ncbi:MAG: hypothetical protein Q8O00_02715 [Holophaga sp.]|nr:hypothetical protein [Holophaga sp.]
MVDPFFDYTDTQQRLFSTCVCRRSVKSRKAEPQDTENREVRTEKSEAKIHQLFVPQAFSVPSVTPWFIFGFSLATAKFGFIQKGEGGVRFLMAWKADGRDGSVLVVARMGCDAFPALALTACL